MLSTYLEMKFSSKPISIIDLSRIMFPLLINNFESLAQQDLSCGQKIQYLIDLLSTDVLKMDLSHIKGDKISEGNLQHLMNFLQLLYEVSKLYNEKKQDSFTNEQYNKYFIKLALESFQLKMILAKLKSKMIKSILQIHKELKDQKTMKVRIVSKSHHQNLKNIRGLARI